MDREVTAILVVLALGLPLVLMLRRLGVSALVGYLATGALVGPSVLGLVEPVRLEPVANIGAALLLFTIGLEMDLGGLRDRLRPVLVATTSQVGLTLVAGTLLCLTAALTLPKAVAVGACLAMSSTVMVLKVLEERRLLGRPEGQLALGVALGQDLALGPLLVLLGFLIPVGHRPSPWLVAIGLIACLAGTIALRAALASRLIARLRAAQLPELEVAFALVLALGAAALTERAGLGAALGAFCAGLALGGEHRAAIEAGTRSLQGLTAILFFVAMGALFDLRFVLAHWWQVAAGVAGSVLIKAPIAALALRLGGLRGRSAWGYGLVLAQVGEFSFVLAAAAFAGAADPDVRGLYQLVVAVTCISLALTPLLALLAKPLLPGSSLDAITASGDSIVVAGLGPVGNAVVDTLRRRGHRLLLIDRNDRLLKPWQGQAGVRCHRGRIEDMEGWLPVLGHRPAVVVLTFPVADTSAVVTRRLRQLDPGLVVLARAPYAGQVDLLKGAGVQHVICDEHETARSLLPLLDRALAEAGGRSDRLRATIATGMALPATVDKGSSPT